MQLIWYQVICDLCVKINTPLMIRKNSQICHLQPHPLQDQEEDVLYDVKSWFANIETEEETINYITEEI